MDILLRFVQEYLEEVIGTVLLLAGKGEGREIEGKVDGRPLTEDVEVGIDRVCEDAFKNHLERSGLSVQVYSEHGTYGNSCPDYHCAIDPFDGSALFRLGFWFEWFSALSIFDRDYNPLLGGIADIIRRRIYIADCERKACWFLDLNTNMRSIISPAEKTTIDDQTVIAGYLMKPKYLLPWMEKMTGLLKKFPGLFIWPNGGAGIYHMIADGRVHAYIMCNEPRSEIDPGLAFARAAGFLAVSVNQDGTYDHYDFLPGKQADRVKFFIAACTEELVQAILREISP